MRPTVFTLTVLLPALTAGGCGNAPNKPKAAIERVLQADDKLAKERNALSPKATPSQVARSIGVYCDALEHLEMSDCPADFRVAFRQHVRAWRDTQAAVKQLPDSFLQGLFMGALNALLGGESDGGTARIHGDLSGATERVRTTYEEVEKIGAKYGAAL